LNESLREEGIARELVNRIQNLRKDSGLEVTDRILLTLKKAEGITEAVERNQAYICSETLADELHWVSEPMVESTLVDFEEMSTEITIQKV